MASTSVAPQAPLEKACRAIEASSTSLKNELTSELVSLKLVAEDLERYEPGSEKIKALENAALEVITAMDEFERHKLATEAICRGYTLGDEPTNFEELIAAEMAKQPVRPAKNSEFHKQFQQTIWNVHHAGEPMPGRELEELVMTSQVAGILNRQCPLSGKPVTELQDPVRSVACRHIYERQAVLRYIANKSNQRCAAAGCPKTLSVDGLVCDAALQIDIQELRVRGIDSNGPPPAFTELDEDES